MTSSTRQSKAASASAEDRGAGRQRDPPAAVETEGSTHAAVAAEALGERLMARRKEVDRECASLAQCGERRGGACEAKR